MKIVILDAGTIPGKDPFLFLRAYGDVVSYDATKESEIDDRIRGAEIVLTNKVPLKKETLIKCDGLRFVSVLATGYNVVDVAYAAEKEITVSNVPSYSADSVAQHTFALIGEIASGVSAHTLAVRAGEWKDSLYFTMKKTETFELAGKTLGIVGHGEIGTRVERIAKAYGMKTLAYARRPFEGRATLDKVLRESDIVSLHCPLNANSFHLIREETIAMMKDGAILVNTSRGDLVDEDALLKALERGKIAFFAADVLSSEPPIKTEITSHPHTRITPHIAWSTTEAVRRLLRVTEDNVRAFLSGAPIHVVSR